MNKLSLTNILNAPKISYKKKDQLLISYSHPNDFLLEEDENEEIDNIVDDFFSSVSRESELVTEYSSFLNQERRFFFLKNCNSFIYNDTNIKQLR